MGSAGWGDGLSVWCLLERERSTRRRVPERQKDHALAMVMGSDLDRLSLIGRF